MKRTAFVFSLFFTLAGGCTKSPDGSETTGNLTPSAILAASPQLIDLGKRTYETQCAPCHGRAGDGQGEAAYLLYPKPRNFVAAKYRLVSTWDYVPTDEDLFRTISRGMPGSAMPPWAHLPERTRWGLAHYVKSFASQPLEISKDHQPESATDTPSGKVQVPPEPSYTPQAEARARQLFLTACAGCHGPQGKGDGQQKQEDSEGFPTRPRDLTAGIYKGSPEPEQVYSRIVAGLPGSPMPSHSYLYGNDAWHLVHYVRQLSSEEQRTRAEMKRLRITARRVGKLPGHPDAALWKEAQPVELHLMPLWWRDDRPETLMVRALHDGQGLALRLAWSDATHDHAPLRAQDFGDAAAVQFSLHQDPPFFAMGEAARAVNIWMWKAEKQANLDHGFQDLEATYPNLAIDTYPDLTRSPADQPMRQPPSLHLDPSFITARGAGNLVSDPAVKGPVEDLTARGFGTLKARAADSGVTAAGSYAIGTYQVVFRSNLEGGGANSVSARAGQTLAVSFAVWDGSAGDRDGKKSVTIWQELFLQP